MRRTHNVTIKNEIKIFICFVAASSFYAKTVHIYHIASSHMEKEGKKERPKRGKEGDAFSFTAWQQLCGDLPPPSLSPPPHPTPHSCVSCVVTKNHWFSTEHLKRCSVIVMGCGWGRGVLWWQRHPAVHKVNQTSLMCYNKNIWSRWLHHWLLNETLKNCIIYSIMLRDFTHPKPCKISVLHFQAVMLTNGHSGRSKENRFWAY